MMVVFTLMGVVGGYTMAKFYKLFDKEDWRVATVLTATFYPGIVFFVFFMLNLMIWGEKSSGAVPFMTMFALLVLWFGVSVPLAFLGAYFGYKKAPMSLPVQTNQIPRQI